MTLGIITHVIDATAYLDSIGFPHAKFLHVNNLARVAINAKGAVCAVSMLGPELGECADDIGSTILGKGAGNDFQGHPNCPVRMLLHTFHLPNQHKLQC